MIEAWGARLPLLCVGLALAEADAWAVGQLMVSRPAVLGPAMGLAAGRPWEGSALGAVLELLTIDDKPLGSVVPFSATMAIGAAVLFVSGPHAVPVEAALAAGLAVGAIQSRVDAAIRSQRTMLADAARERMRAGRSPGWAGLLARGLGSQVLATAALAYACAALGGPVLARLWEASPAVLRGAAAGCWKAAPWIGAAALVRALWRRA
jgi:mannose/fructose/N-acetylgalactosamine-specific phosphotransferase system component IIC